MNCPICSNNIFERKYKIKKYNISKCSICDLVLLGNEARKKDVIKLCKAGCFDGRKSDKGYENYALMERVLQKNYSKSGRQKNKEN